MLLVLAIVGLFLLPAPWSILALAGAAVVEVGEVFAWRRFLRRYRISTGAEGLVGQPAEVIAPCTPRGTVRLRGEIWKARSTPFAGAGDRVRVVAVEGLTLEVEPWSEPE